MLIERLDVEKTIETREFIRSHTTKKVVEYRSSRNGKTLYFRTELGLPQYIRVVIDPLEDPTPFLTIRGVLVNSPKEFQHGSNMTAFPKRKNRGDDEIHYGRAFNISSLSSFAKFLDAFHLL